MSKVFSQGKVGKKAFRKLISAMLAVILMVVFLPVGLVNAAAVGDTLDVGQVGVIMDAESSANVTFSSAYSHISWAQAYGGYFNYTSVNTADPKSITFTPQIPQDGLYDFYVRTPGGKYYSGNVPYTINYEGGSTVVNIVPCADGQTEKWIKLGTESFAFKAVGSYSIVAGGSGYNTYPASNNAATCVDAIKLVKVGEIPNQDDITAVEQEIAKYETASMISESIAVDTSVYSQILRLKDGQSANSEISITATVPTDGTYLKISGNDFILKAQNITGSDVTENAILTFTKGTTSRTLSVTVTIQAQSQVSDDIIVSQEAAKYETSAIIERDAAAGASVLNQIRHLKPGNTVNTDVNVTAVAPADGIYLQATGSDIILKAQNTSGLNASEEAVITFSKGSASVSLSIAVTIIPQLTEAIDTSGDFTNTATRYRDFAPGIFNPNEGTVELTVRIDKPYSEFGNTWDFMFSLVPAQTGPGNTLMNVNIPPMSTKPSGDPTYATPVTFMVRNGVGTTGANAYAQPSSLNYEVGKPFNLAFEWKMGTGGYVAIYKDGVEIGRTATSQDPVMEKFMPYEFMVERGNPFNISNVKISTKALSSIELETNTTSFTRSTDTALIADITLGMDVQSQKFITPWQVSSKYNIVKPAFRSEKQVYYSDEVVVYPVMTVNYGDTKKQYTVSIKATDPYGNVAFTEVKTVTVPADSAYRVEELSLPQLDNKVGFWYLETTISSSASDSITYKSAVSKVKQNDTGIADGKYSDYYGQHASYNFDMSIWPEINTTATRAWEDASVFLWNKIEPVKNHFTWEKADAYVNSAIQNSMDVLAVLGYPSDWASARPAASEMPAAGYTSSYQYRAERWVSKDIQYKDGVPGTGEDWTNYVYQTMKRYAGKVKYYEIVNEVNFHPPFIPAAFSGTEDEYFLMLRIAHEQAQKVKQEYKAETGNDLELYVVSSGFTSIAGTTADRRMAIDALSEPYAGYYDIYNVHGYDGTKGITSILDAYNVAKDTHPDMQLWQGEVYPVNTPSIPSRIYNIVANYLDFMSAGTSKYFNMGVPGDDTFLVRSTQSPTEVFQTMATLQNNIRKVNEYIGSYTGFSGVNVLTVNHYMRRTDGNYLSIFSTDALELDINVNNADKILSVEDSYGNNVPVENINVIGKIVKKNTVFVVSSEPLVIDSLGGNISMDIIRNGTFESTSGDPMGGPSAVTMDNWSMGYNVGTYGTNAYVNTTSPYQGSKAAEFNSAGTPNNRTYMYQKFTITQPGTYMLSAYIKKIEGSDVQPELNIWDGSSDHQLAPVTLTDQYAYYSKTYEVTHSIDLIVNIGILSGVGKVALDNVAFDLVPQSVEAPSNLTGSAISASEILLQWDAPSASQNVASYKIYRDEVELTTVPGTATSYTDTGLAEASSHTYRVETIDTAGNESTGGPTCTVMTPGGVCLSAVDPVDMGAEFATTFKLMDAANVSAQDITISYDTTRFNFVKAEPAQSKVTLQEVINNSDTGSVNIIAACLGAENAINGSADIFILTFSAKAQGDGIISVSNAELADGQGNETDAGTYSLTVKVNSGSRLQLDNLINDAQAKYNNAAEGIENGNYPAGSKDRLLNAIQAATAVKDNTSASEAQLTDAILVLQTAIANFDKLLITPDTGDINSDNKISIGDLGFICGHYGVKNGDAGWSEASKADLNGDGEIGLYELAFIAMRIV